MAPLDAPLGLSPDERRYEERRHAHRGARDRRRRRRRRTVRSLVFGMFTIALPHQTAAPKSDPLRRLESMVSVSEDFRVVPPAMAYNDAIAEAAGLYRLDPNLIRAVIRAESAFNPFAVSDQGAQGLMQLLPEIAQELDVLDSFDPRQNILGGARYLRDLLDRHHGNVDLAVASYNAGPGAVERYKGIPPYRETRDYVKKIKAFMRKARGTRHDRRRPAQPLWPFDEHERREALETVQIR